jgi:hypothetical protein
MIWSDVAIYKGERLIEKDFNIIYTKPIIYRLLKFRRLRPTSASMVV